MPLSTWKFTTELDFLFCFFSGFFGQKNSQNWPKVKKIGKIQTVWKNSEIWYVNASQQKKIQQKTVFWFWHFLAKKTAKIDQIWRKLAKSKPFDKIFWNFVCKCLPTKENSTTKTVFWFLHLLAFFYHKTAKIDQKWRKLVKSKLLVKIFWNLVCRCFPTKQNATKNIFFLFCHFLVFIVK